MIKKLILTLSLSSLAGAAAMAQKACATDDIYNKLKAENPSVAAKEEQLRKDIYQQLSGADLGKLARVTVESDTVVYNIPIVFHVIHEYGAEYVSDAEIYRCVDSINNMFNKMNGDTAEVIAPFKGFIPGTSTRYIGNTRVHWYLARKDPNGNPTNGITRRQSYLALDGGDQAKFDLWPPSSYMNVWLINKMPKHDEAAAYAYKPPTADLIPYYDGVIARFDYLNTENTVSHELGHELNLDHPWGATNDPGIACGDDEVDDTPPTKGHPPGSGCVAKNLFDTVCINTTTNIGKVRIDSIKRVDTTYAVKDDTSTTYGVEFTSRTRTEIKYVEFYPSAAVGTNYKIALSRNGVVINTTDVASTVSKTIQRVTLNYVVPASDTSIIYKLHFLVNPGALTDTLLPTSSSYNKGVPGSAFIKRPATNNYYGFFYNWQIKYGFFKLYAKDSLVDYPDTVNAQNVMDYTYCSKMFTAGQSARMRAALTNTLAGRNRLYTDANLKATGIMNEAGEIITTPAQLAPKAEFSVNKRLLSPISDPSFFMCANASFDFSFTNRTWRATPTSVNWTLSNGATVPTSTTTGTLNTKFTTTGWATITMVASNAVGADTFSKQVYVADPNPINPLGYVQDFNADLDKWPIFNYYNNQFKWEFVNNAGYYDNTSIRYRSYDNRGYPNNLVGDQNGDRDDFFTPGFDLSGLGDNGNLNFMYAGAYITSAPTHMQDSVEIAYSTDCGGNWTVLKTLKGAQLQTVGIVSGSEFVPGGFWDWKPMNIDLKRANGSNIRDAKVFFRFRFRPYGRTVGSSVLGTGNNYYIDRINISNNPLSVNDAILKDRKVAVAPNPTNGGTFVLFQSANAGDINIQVTDVTGKVIYTINQNVAQGNGRIEIPASVLSVKGMYLVRITGNELNQTEKLVVY